MLLTAILSAPTPTPTPEPNAIAAAITALVSRVANEDVQQVSDDDTEVSEEDNEHATVKASQAINDVVNTLLEVEISVDSRMLRLSSDETMQV